MKLDISIKSRLMISSIYMVVMVVAIGLFLFIGGGTLYRLLRGVPLDANRTHPEYFSKVVAYSKEKYFSNWTEDVAREEMREQISEWNDLFRRKGFNLAVYKGPRLLTEESTAISEELSNLVFSGDGEHFMIFDDLGVFSTRVGSYTVAVSYQGIIPKIRYYDENRGTVILLAASGTLLLALFFINLFLMRFVAGPINSAMAALMEGIRHIRDGDLRYRIVYPGHDEFTEICNDFNEMAWRLRESIERIQHEEQVRKELLAGISHDLHTPLAAIKAYVEGLSKGVACTPEKRQHYLETLNRKTTIMEKIIDQLFTFSKLDLETVPMHLSRTDLGEELARVVHVLQIEYCDSGLLLETVGELPSLEADIDRNLLRSVVVNVLENSLKYKDKPCVHVQASLRREGGNLALVFADDGPGVEEGELERIFDVFYRCDKSRSNTEKGSGLGLAIAAKILAQFGGSIRAENVPDGGLAIIITLPVKGQDK